MPAKNVQIFYKKNLWRQYGIVYTEQYTGLYSAMSVVYSPAV